MQTVYLHRLPMNAGQQGSPQSGGKVTRFPCIVGRDPASNVWLTAPFISRRHCALFERDGQVWVRNLGSRHRTFLNGRPVEADQRLRDGDRLELDHVALQVHVPGAQRRYGDAINGSATPDSKRPPHPSGGAG